MHKFFQFAANLQETGLHLARLGLIIVLVWIGGLKAFPYEAHGIMPFVANSPVMSFFLKYDAPDYKKHLNKEGELNPENVTWHKQNRTYEFSYGLGFIIVMIGVLIATYPVWPGISAFGSFLAFGMSLVTLSFLITTPETWVQPLGDVHHGFPYLSGAGRLVIKDVIMLGTSVATMAQVARKYLYQKEKQERLRERRERLVVA